MAFVAPLRDSRRRLGQLLDWLRIGLRPPVVPDHPHESSDPDDRTAWLAQLDRTRALLELARSVIASEGFTAGGWFTVAGPDGTTRTVSGPAALPLRDPRSPVVSACLVGTLVRLAEDPDQPGTVADVWRCVDELYEGVHEQLGHTSMPPGRCSSPAERRLRVADLTAWNDEVGRTREDLVDLVDRAISRTIVGACRA
jgi:hypothetical protein